MTRTVPFEPEHLYGIKLLHAFKGNEAICNNMEYLAELKRIGPCYTETTDDEKVIGSAGVRLITNRTYEGWAILTDIAPFYTKAFIKAIRLFIDTCFKENIVDRVQATVKLNFPAGHRFAKLLGFKPEGILRSYDNGEDYIMYARINTWIN